MKIFSFRSSFFLWTSVVCTLGAFFLWRALTVTEKDQIVYEKHVKQLQEKHEARKKGINKDFSKQTRWNVTKRLWMVDKTLRKEVEVSGTRSEIDIFMRKNEAKLVETFYDVKGYTQQELFFRAKDGKEYVYDEAGKLKKRGKLDPNQALEKRESTPLEQEGTELVEAGEIKGNEININELEPMQTFRYFEADRCVYDYYTQSLIAYDVNFWTYTAKGHKLERSLSELWPESSGSASSMTMCHEGTLNSLEMSAENLNMQVSPEW
jgi:hypothetical protein